MIAFLQRITGTHPAQRAADERFRRQLNGMAQRNKELEDLRAQLRGIRTEVETTGSMAKHSLSPSASGEHMLHLPEGVKIHERESDPGTA